MLRKLLLAGLAHKLVLMVAGFAATATVIGGAVVFNAYRPQTPVAKQPVSAENPIGRIPNKALNGAAQNSSEAKPAEKPPANQQKPANPSNSGSSATTAPTGGGGSGGVSNSCALPNYPNASCTGVPAGTSLTVLNGDLTITTAGTVVEGKDIRGCVIVQAANVTIRKSKITCTSFYAIASYNSYDDGGLLVEDVEIDCRNSNSTGIDYQGLTARRLNIHGCENGLDALRNVTLVDSYIHDIYEGASGHGDGVQSADGSNVTISHNTIYSNSTTSSININNSSGGPTSTNVTISNNLLAGGAYTLYCPIPATVNFKIIDNHFSTIFYPTSGAYGPAADCQNEAQATGNVYHESGQAVTF